MSGVTDLALAVLLGGALAAGLICLLAAMPRWRAASLTARIAPYVRDVVADERMPIGLLPRAGVLPAGASSLPQRALRLFEQLVGGGLVAGVNGATELADGGAQRGPHRLVANSGDLVGAVALHLGLDVGHA